MSTVPQETQQEIATLEETALSLIVSCDDEYQTAADLLTACTELKRTITDSTRPVIKAAKVAHTAALDQEKGLLAPVDRAHATVKGMMSAYLKEQEREAEEQRKAIAAIEKAEHEADKLDRVAELEQGGFHTQAAVVLADDTPPPPTDIGDVRPIAKGISVRRTYTVEVADAGMVPRYYMAPDMVKIRKAVNAAKGKIEIPGVTITEDLTPHSRRDKGDVT